MKGKPPLPINNRIPRQAAMATLVTFSIKTDIPASCSFLTRQEAEAEKAEYPGNEIESQDVMGKSHEKGW